MYGTARRIIRPGDRKSLSYYVEGVNDILNDNLYIGPSSFEGTCTKYFFSTDSIIPDEYKVGLGVEILNKDEALSYLRTNTNMVEVSENTFEISPETEVNWEITPAKYLSII